MNSDDDSDARNLDGKRFRPVASDGDGEVGGETTFEFSQDGETIYARYAGGDVRLGFLVGVHRGDELHFRYAQVNRAGETATGQSTDRIELLEDGRIRLHETWSWDSKDGEGTSVLEEVKAGESIPEG